MWVAGVDGCANGWVIALRNIRTGELRLLSTHRLEAIFSLEEKPSRMVVDMPMGLTTGASAIGRQCEAEARKLLKKKSHSVFSTPSRDALYASTYQQAVQLNVNRAGIAPPAVKIMLKIREVDSIAASNTQDRFIEGHPELAFYLLNGNAPVMSKKADPDGESERLDLLKKIGIIVQPQWLDDRVIGAERNDIVDAIVLTRTAERHLNGDAVCLPAKPPRDTRGLKMEIWY
jgi:predicted RNase H-like nuclease